jgi:methyl-accepting chemotaxis protein
MNIRTKLLVLTLGTQTMMVVALVLYILAAQPIETLQKENARFQEAALASDVLLAETNKLATMPIEEQFAVYQKAMQDYRDSLARVKELKLLPTIDPEMKSAVESVGKLGELTDESFEKTQGSVKDLFEDRAALVGSQTGITIELLTSKSYDSAAKEQTRNLTHFHLANFFNNLRQANDVLNITSALIREKQELVNTTIAGYRTRSYSIVMGLIVAIMLVVTAVSLLISSGIAKALVSLRGSVEVIGTGDLTKRIGMTRNDEIGKLGTDLDGLIDTFNRSIRQIQTASGQNSALRDEVIEASTEAGNAAVEIEANSGSIGDQMRQMDRMIGLAGKSTTDAADSIGTFNARIVEQNRNVADTVAAVTEMMASIGSIGEITRRDREAAEKLVTESERVRGALESVFGKIGDIAASVNAIQEMAEVIAAIASQTNILSMNAAIEAAHAGDAGKGFAVVADEIGKLAEASAVNSDEIAKSITDIVSKIGEANGSRETAAQTFGVISESIRSVSDSIAEISGNMNEMQAGGTQILSSMEEMRSSSEQITGESAKIRQNADEIGKTMGDLGRVSREVTSNIGEISTGIAMITANVRSVAGQAEKMAEVGGKLDEAVAAFKISGA